MAVSYGADVTKVEVPYGRLELVRFFPFGILAILITIFMALGDGPSNVTDLHYPDFAKPPEFNGPAVTAINEPSHVAEVVLTATPRYTGGN